MAIPVTLSTGDATQVSNDVSSELLINCYPILKKNNQVSNMTIAGSHGYFLFGTNTSGTEYRASKANDDGTAGYVLIDTKFYSVSTAGVLTERGTLATSTGRGYIAVGNSQVVVVDGNKGYYYVPATTTFAEITDAQFPTNPTIVSYQDGYFTVVGIVSANSVIALSDLNDAINWTVLNQLVPSGFPSTLVSFVIVNNYLWLLGSSFAEARVNTGIAGDFPYSKINFEEYGCAATHSVASIGGYGYWLARTRQGKAFLVRANSSSVSIIDNETMASVFDSFTTVSDAWAYTYREKGQEFYELSFPTANQTWVYCITSNFWFKKMQADGTRFIANAYMFLNGKHIIGSRTSGAMYHMATTYYTENGGSNIKRTLVFPTLYSEDKTLQISLMRCIVDSSTYYKDGELFSLDVSYDGGDNYEAIMTDTVLPNTDYAMFSNLSAGRRITPRLIFDTNKRFYLINCMIQMLVRGE